MRDAHEWGRDENSNLKVALNAGILLFVVAGLAVGALWEVFFGTAVFAVGVVLLAIRGYMGSGDKAVTGVLSSWRSPPSRYRP